MGKLIDLTGKKFGKLKIISRNGTDENGCAIWNCLCDCGNETTATTHSLNIGHKKSCSISCARLIDIIGQKFGRWTVLKKGKQSNRGAYWLCKCQCGTIKEVSSNDLRKGISTSCGCSFRLAKGESAKKWLFNHIKYDAIKRGYSFELTYEQFGEITKRNCFYCSVPPSIFTQRNKYSKAYGDYIYNGIDRKNNLDGYTPENSVPCCKECNRMKSDMDFSKFIEHIHKISKNFEKK